MFKQKWCCDLFMHSGEHFRGESGWDEDRLRPPVIPGRLKPEPMQFVFIDKKFVPLFNQHADKNICRTGIYLCRLYSVLLKRNMKSNTLYDLIYIQADHMTCRQHPVKKTSGNL